MHLLSRTLLLAGTALSLAAWAGDAPDPASLYEVKTEVASARVEAGEKARLLISITAKQGAHVSDEAPLRLELSGTNATPEKARLTLADSLEKPTPGQKYPNPRFEAVYTAVTPGQGTLDANLTFFICTDTLCARQVKKLSVPLTITAANKAL
ncbi:MAG: hypothetical protein M3Y59_19430 [Myxococcota bacterium]|nr:hypothetical protein [Myxococcota bacterium]